MYYNKDINKEGVVKMKKQQAANKRWADKNPEHAIYLKTRSAARSFIRNRAELEDLEELKELIKNRKEELKMDYTYELKQLKKGNGTNGSMRIDIYENKEDLLQTLSENEDEPKETYDFMKEELDYLSDDRTIYSVDIGNGFPTYYEDAKEAYDSI